MERRRDEDKLNKAPDHPRQMKRPTPFRPAKPEQLEGRISPGGGGWWGGNNGWHGNKGW
jgi:hypothetical protein